MAGMRSPMIFEPAVVRIPLVSYKSFRDMGIPCNGPRYLPFAICLCAARAALSAPSASTVMYALIIGSSVSICSSTARVRSTGEILRDFTLGASCEMVIPFSSFDMGSLLDRSECDSREHLRIAYRLERVHHGNEAVEKLVHPGRLIRQVQIRDSFELFPQEFRC